MRRSIIHRVQEKFLQPEVTGGHFALPRRAKGQLFRQFFAIRRTVASTRQPRRHGKFLHNHGQNPLGFLRVMPNVPRMAPPESGISSSDQPDLVECIPMLRPYVARHVPRDQVEDFLQEIMLRLHQRQSTSPIDNFRAYAFQTARSVIVDRGRRDTVRKQDEHFALTELHHPVDHITPEQVLLGRESLQRLAAALERMPERTRDIFVLQRFEEMSYPAIAEHLEISLSAVGKHMVKALRLLAEEVFP